MKRNNTGGALWRSLPVAVFCASASFAQATWTLRNPATPTVTLRAVAWSGSQVVVAGDSGKVSTSANAAAAWTWAPQTSGTTNAINGLTGNTSLFVAVGDNGNIRTANGTGGFWSGRSSGTSVDLHGVSRSGDQYVAVGASGTIITSSNGTSNWTARVSGTARRLNAVEYGLDFVAVGDTGTILSSSSGTEGWTVRTSSTTSNLRRVRHANNLYVVVGDGGVIRTAVSPTSFWTTRASGTTRRLSGLHYGSGLWVAVGDSGTILTSFDGMSWTTRVSGVTAALHDVVWTGSRFVAVGAGGVLLTSEHGMDWAGSAPFTQVLNGIAWTGSQYVAVGNQGTMLTSPDGFAWTPRTSGTTEELTAVSDNGAQIVAVGESGVIRNSTNGTVWGGRTSGTLRRFLFVRWGGGLFVAGGEGGLLATSPDGLTWTVRASGTEAALHAVASANGQHYVTGASGTILSSPDGVTWTARPSGTTASLNALRWTGSRWVAVGTGGIVLLSADGVAWERLSAGTANALHGLVWSSSQLVAVGAGGTVVTSPNGVTWGPQVSGTGAELRAVDYTGSQFAAVGAGGMILTATSASLTGAPPVPVLVSPADNAANVTDNPLGLVWQLGSGGTASGTTYRVQLATDSLFTALVRNDSGLTATSFNAGAPAANTTYYWRVRAKNGGYSSFWTETRRFSTENTSTPVLISPANNASDVPLSTTLQWSAVSGALAYRVQLSTTSDFSAVILDDSTLTGLSRNLAGLAVNTTYHWRVRARSSSGSSAWSTARPFTTISGPPVAPVLTAPAQNATAVSVFTSLTWNAVSTASGYRVQVATDSLFATPLRDDSSLTDPSWRGTALPGNATLYWRALARNQLGAGAWSLVRRFTTAPVPTTAPPAPVLAAPLNFAVNLPLSTSLLWNVLAEASHYRVQLSTQPTFSPSTSVVLDDSALTAVQKSVSAMSGNTDYYWRVSARNPVGTGPWSEVWAFRTVVAAPTAAPVLVSPSAFASAVAIPATLSWNAVSGATGYRVQVSTVPDFSTWVMNNGGITGLTAQSSSLAAHTDYYWRVAALNAAGMGPYSSVWRFTTGVLPVPDAPTLLIPVPVAIDVPVSPTFTWTASTLATAYHIQVSTAPDFTNTAINDSARVTTTVQTSGSLQSGREHYWRVRAKNSSGVSAWSATSRFTTVISSSLADRPALSRAVADGGWELRFVLAQRGRVTVRVHDLRGQLLFPVIDETREAGSHVLAMPGGVGSSLRILDFRAGELHRTLILQP